tara:strand:+ start:8591 stop:8863 length:273 start_codon:yes stop_codon:yes gene_type:complete
MAIVYIPTMFLDLTDGEQQIEAVGNYVRDVVDNLEMSFPGIKSRLVHNRKLKEDLAVAIDGETCRLGLMEPIPSTAKEIHFIAAIAGGIE